MLCVLVHPKLSLYPYWHVCFTLPHPWKLQVYSIIHDGEAWNNVVFLDANVGFEFCMVFWFVSHQGFH
jgi:hypothetical protein